MMIDYFNLGMLAVLVWFGWQRERHVRRLQAQLDESYTVMAEQHLALCLAAGDDPGEVQAMMIAKIRSERSTEQ